ncbi:MAG: pilus assembly protein TadG-related protein, partial [Chloroflexota bacterium]
MGRWHGIWSIAAALARRPERRGQSGQSVVLFALMLVSIVAGTGLIVDTGYSYQQERLAQNAADAASMAAAQALASKMSTGMSDSAMVALLNQYATANLPGSTIGGHYLDGNGNVIVAIGSGYNVPPVSIGSAPTVAGVTVSVTHTHGTFLLRVLGDDSVTVHAGATGMYGSDTQLVNNLGNGTQVLPFNVNDASYWGSVNGCGGYTTTPITFTASTGVTAPFSCVGEADGFNWGPLNDAGSSNSDSVTKSLLLPGTSYSNPLIPGTTTVQVSTGERATDFFSYLQTYWTGKTVVVPLLNSTDVATKGCPGCSVRVQEFAYFHVTYVNGQSSPKIVQGYWVNPLTQPALPGGSVPTTSTVIT